MFSDFSNLSTCSPTMDFPSISSYETHHHHHHHHNIILTLEPESQLRHRGPKDSSCHAPIPPSDQILHAPISVLTLILRHPTSSRSILNSAPIENYNHRTSALGICFLSFLSSSFLSSNTRLPPSCPQTFLRSSNLEILFSNRFHHDKIRQADQKPQGPTHLPKTACGMLSKPDMV